MSFDIFFQPVRYSGKTLKKKNPFTGQVQSVLESDPLTPAEVQAVRAVLKEAGAKQADEFGCYALRVADGGEAEVVGENLAESCMVALRGLTPGLVTFLMDLLKAGNWVMLPAMEGNPALTAAPDHLKGVPKDFPEITTCTSADELGVILTNGLGAWQRYRDQVVSRAGRGKRKR